MTDDELVAAARDAALKAYAPYSRFSVGCAIEGADGTIVTGANMENACYRLGLCAEQSALTAAAHAFGLGNVARIAVAGATDREARSKATHLSRHAAAAVRRSSRLASWADATSRCSVRRATERGSSGIGSPRSFPTVSVRRASLTRRGMALPSAS
ncbi:hypothetical protein [Sphingomonas sp. HDW15A]|uniref:cytidine deaminase family protein n=1 Tax=Sphingomonas sp. HDW15A TaxID=2714942 RepID=UPI00321655F6